MPAELQAFWFKTLRIALAAVLQTLIGSWAPIFVADPYYCNSVKASRWLWGESDSCIACSKVLVRSKQNRICVHFQATLHWLTLQHYTRIEQVYTRRMRKRISCIFITVSKIIKHQLSWFVVHLIIALQAWWFKAFRIALAAVLQTLNWQLGSDLCSWSLSQSRWLWGETIAFLPRRCLLVPEKKLCTFSSNITFINIKSKERNQFV